MKPLNLALAAAYLGALLAAGPFLRRLVRSSEDFMVGGRRVGLWFGLGTLTMIFVGGGAVGAAGQGYAYGPSGAWYFWALSLGFAVLGLTLVVAVRRLEQVTIADILGTRFGKPAQRTVSVVTLGAWLFFLASLIVAAARVIEALLGLPLPAAILLVGAAAVSLAGLGGLLGSAMINAGQAVLLIAGVAVVFMVTLVRAGGSAGVASAFPAGHAGFLPADHAGYVVAILLVVAPTTLVAPDVYLNVWSLRDDRTARRTVLLAAAVIAAAGLMLALTGAGARALAPGIQPEQALPAMADRLLVPGLSGLVLATLMGAAMSGAVPEVIVCSSILTHDLYHGWLRPNADPGALLRFSRVAAIAVGAAACGLGLLLPGVVALALFAYRVFIPAAMPQVLAALYWRGARPRAVAASTIAGPLAALGQSLLAPATLLTPLDPVVLGTAVSVGVLVGGSLLAPAPKVAAGR